jgi:hypothetical protein
LDPDYQAGGLRSFFLNHFGLDTILSAQSSTMLLPADTALPVFQGWDSIFPIYLKASTQLAPLVTRCTTEARYPLLKDDLGNVVAIAHVDTVGGVERGRIMSSFGLEHIRLDTLPDTLKLDTLLVRLHRWMFEPTEGFAGQTPCCPANKGDLNADGNYTAPDVVCILNCAFLGGADPPCICDLCVADVNCDGQLVGSDVLVEMNRVFLGLTAPPWCGP